MQSRALVKRGVVRPYLELMRPANLATAAADVLAGAMAAGASLSASALGGLILASLCLYAGGVVFNDVMDARVDAQERPERPLPSGRARMVWAVAQGSLLLLGGILLAFVVHPVSGLIAIAITLAALTYDAWAKHHHFVGPTVMGSCRSLNLMLGISAAPLMLTERWPLGLIPLAFVAAITSISRGEVHGGSRHTGAVALGLLTLVLIGLPGFVLIHDGAWLPLLPFWGFFAWRVVPPFWRAFEDPDPDRIREAVRAGVLSLIPLNAVIAAGFGGIPAGLLVLGLLPVAQLLARRFAVT